MLDMLSVDSWMLRFTDAQQFGRIVRLQKPFSVNFDGRITGAYRGSKWQQPFMTFPHKAFRAARSHG